MLWHEYSIQLRCLQAVEISAQMENSSSPVDVERVRLICLTMPDRRFFSLKTLQSQDRMSIDIVLSLLCKDDLHCMLCVLARLLQS